MLNFRKINIRLNQNLVVLAKRFYNSHDYFGDAKVKQLAYF